MSWSFEIIETWVNTALVNLGYTEAQAKLGAQTVTWLQQRHAPGVAAMAQHIDFLSAHQCSPAHGGDNDALCPILLSESLQPLTQHTAQTYQSVRQPLLVLPALSTFGGLVRWDGFETDLSNDSLDIEYDRKSLRTVLLASVDVQWAPHASTHEKTSTQPLNPSNRPATAQAPSNRHARFSTEVLPRELVYVKTLQHYAGTLPPPEPIDRIEEADNTSSNI